MTNFDATVKFDITPLEKLTRKLAFNSVNPKQAKRMAFVYGEEMKRRWASNPFPPPKHREGHALRDTGTAFRSLTVGARGNTTIPIRHGVRFGYSNAKHPESDVSIRRIMVWHQTGAGNLPKRETLIVPDKRIARRLVKVAAESVQDDIKRVSK